MTLEWRPANDPPNIPLTLYAHEDFVRIVGFSGPVNTFPVGTTIRLDFYPDADPATAATATWPAAVDLLEQTGAWSVDYATVDALPFDRGFYRLWMTVPNASDTSNPSIERCLALGKLTRK